MAVHPDFGAELSFTSLHENGAGGRLSGRLTWTCLNPAGGE
jgi:hypothetical protein